MTIATTTTTSPMAHHCSSHTTTSKPPNTHDHHDHHPATYNVDIDTTTTTIPLESMDDDPSPITTHSLHQWPATPASTWWWWCDACGQCHGNTTVNDNEVEVGTMQWWQHSGDTMTTALPCINMTMMTARGQGQGQGWGQMATPRPPPCHVTTTTMTMTISPTPVPKDKWQRWHPPPWHMTSTIVNPLPCPSTTMMTISITIISRSIHDLINIFTAVSSTTSEGIPICGYTQGYLAPYPCVDPDPQSGYGFTAGPGPGLTCDTQGSTHATP